MARAGLIIAIAGLAVSAATLYIVVRVGLELQSKTDEVKTNIVNNPIGKLAMKLMGVKL